METENNFDTKSKYDISDEEYRRKEFEIDEDEPLQPDKKTVKSRIRGKSRIKRMTPKKRL